MIGDKLTGKKENVIGFYFKNFNGKRSGARGTDKRRYFGKLMKLLELDCFGEAETKLQWNMTRLSPRKLLDLKTGSRTAYACNKNDQTTNKYHQKSGSMREVMGVPLRRLRP